MLKYRDNMTDAETKAFMAEQDALDAAYAGAARFDEEMQARYADGGSDEDCEDEMEYWKSAGLDHRGLP